MNMKNPVAILLGFCLVAMLFRALPVAYQQETREYDPWCDIDDSGLINMKDIYEVALRFGTAGDPTKNVNVTNWPDWPIPQKEYKFFSYKFGSQPLVYISDEDATVKSTTNMSFVTVKEYTIDATSNLSTGMGLTFACMFSTQGALHYMEISIVINDVRVHTATSLNTNLGEWLVLPPIGNFSLDTSKTSNIVQVQIRSLNGNQVSIKNDSYKLYLDYSKRILTPEDFNCPKLYLVSVRLESGATIIVNNDRTQVFMNPYSSARIIEFPKDFPITQVEFASGDPEILICAPI
jgi:hypothetical protein